MFKKAVEVKTQQRLSGADRKKLKRTLKDRYPNASDSDFDILLPPKVEITVAKYPNRVLVYGIEGGCPMFIDVDGRGAEVLPTVYALWQVPNLVPAFILKGGEVSRFVLGGADLMFPGIQIPPDGLPSFSAGEPWAVMVPGNPAPIAIGTTTVSSTDAIKAGLRGKALRICHYYGDMLWASTDHRYVPNAGFYEDVVFEDPALLSTSQAAESGDGDASIDQEVATNNEKRENVIDVHDPSITLQPTDNPSEVIGQTTNDLGDMSIEEKVSVQEASTEDQHSLSVVEIDALLNKCLLQALHTTVKDKDLPMPGSTLWSGHVLPCRPSGVTVDIKKSSYKKLSKWLQAKASSGLIVVKEDKHKKEVNLFSVNRKHPDYTSFKPEKKKAEKNVQSMERAANDGQMNKTLEIVELYKPSVHVNPILSAVGADTGRLYSASEASEIVFQYVDKENLVKPTNKAVVVLDATLCDALFKGAIKKGSAYPTEIHKKDLGSTFIGRMQAHHLVSRGSDSAVWKGSIKPIQILTERRQGNKKVTKLSGLESYLVDPEALASELQKKFACSTTVGELPGKKGLEVLIQGGVIEDVARHLVDQYGILKRYIEVYDKTKK